MPDLTSTAGLKDLIGADSHTLSKLLPAASNFIDLDSKTWSRNADFVAVKAMIQNLPAINDAAERAFLLSQTSIFYLLLQNCIALKKIFQLCAIHVARS